MLLLGLILILFVLIGIVGLQFTYMFYHDRLHLERKKYIRAVERKCKKLSERLEIAQQRITEQDDLLKNSYAGLRKNDEIWADVIEDR